MTSNRTAPAIMLGKRMRPLIKDEPGMGGAMEAQQQQQQQVEAADLETV